uniref:Uncharacterized protein n=1 Tax=Meloidogyne enterolobii TaxID=390850 RepID=A0A6V7WHH9_MELEN|nr:unnamed protein product [Meloidogyne enterolobii]
MQALMKELLQTHLTYKRLQRLKLPLKEDKRKRKTWVWVPVVEEERKELENIETNSRGRAVRNSKKKAAENISASLTRKTTTIASTKETKSVRRREASL